MRNEFQAVALKYGAGTFVAQLISLASTIVISHLYTPADYGLFISFLTVTAILLPIVTLKIESLIATSEFYEEVEDYKNFAFQLSKVICLNLALLAFLFLYSTMNLALISVVGHSIAFGLILYLQSSSIILVQTRLKSKLFNEVNLSGILQNFLTLVFQSCLGIVRAGMLSLEIAFILGRSAGLIPLRLIGIEGRKRHRSQISKAKVLDIIYRSKNFILISGVEATLIALPIYFVRNFYGNNYAGYLGLIQSIYLVPVSLVSSSIAAIAFSESRNIVDKRIDPKKDHQQRLIKSFARPLILITVIFTFTSLLFGEKLFTLVTGPQWHEMLVLIPILTVSGGVNFFWYPFTNLMTLKNKSHKVLTGALGRLFLGSIAFFLSLHFDFSWHESVTCFFATQVFFQIVWMIMHYKE